MWPPHPHPIRAEAPRHPTLWVAGAGLVCALWLASGFQLQALPARPLSSVSPPELLPRELPLLPPRHIDLRQATDLLVETVVHLESQGDPLRVGKVGERGLMQIRPETWAEVTRRHFGEEISFERAFEPLLNRQVGRLYLGDLQNLLYEQQAQWKADLRSLLLAAYNAGPERLKQAGFDLRRMPDSTRDYARRGAALHDTFLKQQALALHELLIQSLPGAEAETAATPSPD